MEFSAVNRRRPSCETPLGPGAKKDGCFRRLVRLRQPSNDRLLRKFAFTSTVVNLKGRVKVTFHGK